VREQGATFEELGWSFRFGFSFCLVASRPRAYHVREALLLLTAHCLDVSLTVPTAMKPGVKEVDAAGLLRVTLNDPVATVAVEAVAEASLFSALAAVADAPATGARLAGAPVAAAPVTELAALLAAKDREGAALLAAKDRQLAAMDQQLADELAAERAELAALLAAKDQQLAAKDLQLAAKDREIAVLRSDLSLCVAHGVLL
jgi:hypothetical protein